MVKSNTRRCPICKQPFYPRPGSMRTHAGNCQQKFNQLQREKRSRRKK